MKKEARLFGVGVLGCGPIAQAAHFRPLGEDSYTYKRQLEGFADTILKGTPQQGAAGANYIVPGSLMFGEDPKEMRTWLTSL